MELLYLDESQNATFDDDYHSPREMEAKLKRVNILVGETKLRFWMSEAAMVGSWTRYWIGFHQHWGH